MLWKLKRTVLMIHIFNLMGMKIFTILHSIFLFILSYDIQTNFIITYTLVLWQKVYTQIDMHRIW